jgi:hypothetical protein
MTLSCRNCSFDRASMPLYGTRDLKTPQTPSGPLRPLQTSLKTLKPPQTSSDPLKPPQTPSNLPRPPQTPSDPLRVPPQTPSDGLAGAPYLADDARRGVLLRDHQLAPHPPSPQTPRGLPLLSRVPGHAGAGHGHSQQGQQGHQDPGGGHASRAPGPCLRRFCCRRQRWCSIPSPHGTDRERERGLAGGRLSEGALRAHVDHVLFNSWGGSWPRLPLQNQLLLSHWTGDPGCPPLCGAGRVG